MSTENREIASKWYYTLRDSICHEINKIEEDAGSTARVDIKPWVRANGGGGEHAILRGGSVFEKVAVNVSVVMGTFSPDFAKQMPGTEQNASFWASGLSLIAHMQSPHIPAVHLNTRHICTQTSWFGGGIDLTPAIPDIQETVMFHDRLREMCNNFDSKYYPSFSQQCRDYFYLPHRQQERGIGGIFYDYLTTNNWQNDFAFNQAVGRSFIDIFLPIVRQKQELPWTEKEKEIQLYKRGLYAEFILLYDRGTRFGLNTDGNIEAIFSSLPPGAKW